MAADFGLNDGGVVLIGGISAIFHEDLFCKII